MKQPCWILSLVDRGPTARNRNSSKPRTLDAALSAARRCSIGCRACSTMPRSPSATPSRRSTGIEQPHGWAERNALYLAASEAMFEDAAHARRSPAPGCRRPDRRRRHRLDHRHRHPQPRGARRPARWAFAPTSRACRCSAWAAPAASPASPSRRGSPPPSPGTQLAVRHRRDLLDLDPPRQRRPRRHRRHRLVRRRRRGGRASRAGEGGLAHARRRGRETWPDTLDIMGWRVEDPGLGVIFDRAIPPFVEAELAAAVDGILRAARPRARRHRPLLLPSRRRQGDRRDRDRARARPGRRSTSSARCCATTATCARRPCCSCSSGCSSAGLPERVMMTAFGPGFTCAGLLLEAA